MEGRESGDQNIDLEQSQAMNQDQQALFLNIQRSKSADSFIGKLLPTPHDMPTRSLVIDLPPRVVRPQQDSPQHPPSPKIHVFRKVKKERVKSKCDYEKNICGYITKKVIREFLGPNYRGERANLTHKYGCSEDDCKAYFLKKVELVTGPSHLPELFTPAAADSDAVCNSKRAFREFYRWFLKERYLRYLLLEGKMTNKKAYIDYKNQHLFQYVREEEAPPLRMQTRSRSGVKVEQD